MALADYTDLQGAIETWRERSGDSTITSNSADLIALAEAKMTRILPLREMWENTELTGTEGSRDLSLPSDYVERKFLKLTTGSQFNPLRYMSADIMPYSSTAGDDPQMWTINGDKIELNIPCGSALTFQFRYRKKFSLATTTTNWLLSNHPDVYLAGVLVWSGLLLKDDDIVVWQNIWDRGVEELSWIDNREPATLSVDPALWRRGGSAETIIIEDFSGDFG